MCYTRTLGEKGFQVPLSVVLSDAARHCTSPVSIAVCLGAGKRQGRGPVAPGTPQLISSISSSPQEGALSVYCRRRRCAFLVDSGADVSVFPATASQMKFPAPVSLQAANGTSIRTFGTTDIKLALPGLSVVHKFLLADVKKPVLGSDFFRRHQLLIDVARQRLVRIAGSSVSSLVVRARPAIFSGDLCGLKCSPSVAVDEIFAKFPTVTAASPSYDSSVPPLSLIHI